MWISAIVAGLLISCVYGAPISEPRELDKRRESTPEILNLEHQLKKASGENKQLFSFNAGRPMAQIDGLTKYVDDENEMPVVQPDDDITNGAVMDSDTYGGPVDYTNYEQLWKELTQHPEYMKDIMPDYMSVDQSQGREGGVRGQKRESSGAFVYPYYGNNMDDRPDAYSPSDGKGREDAFMAEYFAANSRPKFAMPNHQLEVDTVDGDTEPAASDFHHEPDRDDYHNFGDDSEDDDSVVGDGNQGDSNDGDRDDGDSDEGDIGDDESDDDNEDGKLADIPAGNMEKSHKDDSSHDDGKHQEEEDDDDKEQDEEGQLNVLSKQRTAADEAVSGTQYNV